MAITYSLKIANELSRAGKLEDAQKEYQRLIELNPYFAWNYYYLGQLFFKQGKWQDAVTQYRLAIKLNPNSAYFHNSLAEVLIQQGELDEAINESQKAICIKPDWAIYHETLALAYEAQSDFGQALKTWQKILSFNPSHWRATQKVCWLQTDVAQDFIRRGDKLNKERKIEESVEQYQQALILDCQQPMLVYRTCGNNLITLGKFEEAERVFQQFIKVHPEVPDGYEGYARLIHSLGNWELALKRWEEAIVKFPENLSFQVQKGNALINLSRFDEAEAVFQQLIEKYPHQPHGYEGYARLTHSLGNWELALKRWEEAIVKFPENIGFQVQKGNAFINLSRFDEAKTVFQELIQKHPNQPHGYDGYGRVAHSLSDWELALECWENGIANLPHHFAFHLQKGDVLLKLSRYEEAETWWEKVISKYPDRHEGLSKSASLARWLGNCEFALQRLEQIIEKFPGHLYAYCEAAKNLITIGRFAEAEEKFQDVLQRNPNYLPALYEGGILASQQGNRELALERFERTIEFYRLYNPQKAIDFYILAATELKYLGRESEAMAKYEQILTFHQQRGLYPGLKLLGTSLTSIQELGLLLDRLVTKPPDSVADIVSLANWTEKMLFSRSDWKYPAPVAKDAPSLLPKLKILRELFGEVIATQEDCEQYLLVLKHFNMAIQLLEKESQRLNSREWERVKLVRTKTPLPLMDKFCIEDLSSSAHYIMGADEGVPKSQIEATVKYLPGLMDKEKEYFAASVQRLANSLKLRSRQTIEVFKDFIFEPPFGISEEYIVFYPYYYSPTISEKFVQEFINENTSSSMEQIMQGNVDSRMGNTRAALDEIAIRKTLSESYYEDELVFGLPGVGVVWGVYHNYGHLLFDQIPSLILYQKLNLSCKIFVPHITDSHWDIFGHLNIPKEKILVKQEQKFKYFTISRCQNFHNIEMIDFYRNLRKSIVAKCGDIPSEYRVRYVYISRRYTQSRKMANEVEVEELMASLGFSIVYAERLSFEEKAMLMDHAAVVVSPFGTGHLNCLMCHPGTTVVAITPPGGFMCPYNFTMCCLGLYNLYLLLGDQIANGWETNIDKLKRVITAILEGN